MGRIFCKCDVCTFHREMHEVVDLIHDPLIREVLRQKIEQMETENEAISTDLGRLEAIIKGDWYNSEDVMKDYGWQRIPETPPEQQGTVFEISSHSITGKENYKGLATLVGLTVHGGLFRGQDGNLHEVKLSHPKYPLDYMQEVRKC